jgi:hypothetical protein
MTVHNRCGRRQIQSVDPGFQSFWFPFDFKRMEPVTLNRDRNLSLTWPDLPRNVRTKAGRIETSAKQITESKIFNHSELQ